MTAEAGDSPGAPRSPDPTQASLSSKNHIMPCVSLPW